MRWPYDSLVITRKGTERICRAAFELARKRNGAPGDGKKRVTVCDKANVLRTYAFFRKIFNEVAEQYPDIEADYAYADAMTVHLLERPEHYDVIVMENMFGDIMSDLAAATVGSMGMSPSSELGENNGFFQAAHGSAPTIAGQNVANPYGTILSAASMLQWLGERHSDERLITAAGQIERSVEAAMTAPSGLNSRPGREGKHEWSNAARCAGPLTRRAARRRMITRGPYGLLAHDLAPTVSYPTDYSTSQAR